MHSVKRNVELLQAVDRPGVVVRRAVTPSSP
jgi:hypothetical protein